MSARTSNFNSLSSVADYMGDQQKDLFAAGAEELASIRLSILLTEEWAALETITAQRYSELRNELDTLRSSYHGKVDELAMTFGVQKAIEAKEEVERDVELPDDMSPSAMPIDSERLFS